MFGLDAYHILLAALGHAIILAYWLPRFVSGREPATSTLLILFGLVTFTLIPGMPEAIGPVEHPRPWELLAELCVIVGLFGTGLRIDRLAGRKQWLPTLRLLLIAMPATILMLAIAGWAVAGMTLAGGLLLGAVLAPTDPVLAGDVQVGPPHEGGEHPVRYTLTTEAGLNDGLAKGRYDLSRFERTARLNRLDVGRNLRQAQTPTTFAPRCGAPAPAINLNSTATSPTKPVRSLGRGER